MEDKMKRFAWIALLPTLAAAQSTPDEVLQRLKARLNVAGYSLPYQTYQTSETLVNGIYAFWSPSGVSTLSNESASIMSEDGGKTWKSVAKGLPVITDAPALRDALLNNVKLNELLVQRYGKGQRKLIYFTAFDCPYCAKFEKNWTPLPKMGNATVYVVPSNLDSSDAARSKVVRALWCANSTWAQWVDFAQTRKPKPEILRADTSQCSAIRTTQQAWLLQRMLRPEKGGVPFLLADDGWSGTPSPQVSDVELKLLFTPPKGATSPLKFGQAPIIELANWGVDQAAPLQAVNAGVYYIGEGLPSYPGADSSKSLDPNELKKLKATLKKVF
jgi:hypothetical protein